MNYPFKALGLILCALLLSGISEARDVSSINNSPGDSELKVALLDFGPIGDHGWTYEAHDGASKMAGNLPYVSLTEMENAAGPQAAQVLREYAGEGYKLIFCHSTAFQDAVQEVAPQYPDTIFMLCGGTEKLASNVGTYYARIYEVQYLAGMVAGSMTSSDKIAFSAALPHPEVVLGIDAFARGVASVNPKARVHLGWVGAWYDPDREKSVALSLINSGCDVMTYWSDSDAAGEAAEENGVYFISFGSDTARFTPNVFLTGALWNWEPIMTDIAESVHNGTWQSRPGQDWWYGLAQKGVKMAPFSGLVPDHVREMVEAKQEAIASGELVIIPNMSDEDLQKVYYLEPNVVGSLPELPP